MLKQITAILFLTAFVAQTFSKPFILLDYHLNTIAYAKNCINKARPMMHCNGKCQVMKKIKEEAKKEQENEQRSNNLKSEVLSTRSFYPSVFIPEFVTTTAIKNPVPYNIFIRHSTAECFHPPQA